MPGPTRLLDWPWVVLRVECEPCRYGAGYRLARLAERYGAEAELAMLLERVRTRCRLVDRGHGRRRQPAWACSICLRVPAGGPMPEGVESREAAPDDPWPPRPKRVEPAGPLPTVGSALGQGCTAVLVYCAGRRADGNLCHHQGRVEIDDLALPLDWPWARVAGSRRLWCSRCGSRDVEVRADHPSVRGQMAPPAGKSRYEIRNGIVVEVGGAGPV